MNTPAYSVHPSVPMEPLGLLLGELDTGLTQLSRALTTGSEAELLAVLEQMRPLVTQAATMANSPLDAEQKNPALANCLRSMGQKLKNHRLAIARRASAVDRALQTLMPSTDTSTYHVDNRSRLGRTCTYTSLMA